MEIADKLLWRPLSQGHIAAYGFREMGDESAIYATVGFSEYQYRQCLEEFLGKGS